MQTVDKSGLSHNPTIVPQSFWDESAKVVPQSHISLDMGYGTSREIGIGKFEMFSTNGNIIRMARTRGAYSRATEVLKDDWQHGLSATDLMDVSRALDKWARAQETGKRQSRRPKETRHGFTRKPQAPPQCQSLRQAILHSTKATVQWLKELGMAKFRDGIDPSSSVGWESYIIDDGQRK